MTQTTDEQRGRAILNALHRITNEEDLAAGIRVTFSERNYASAEARDTEAKRVCEELVRAVREIMRHER